MAKRKRSILSKGGHTEDRVNTSTKDEEPWSKSKKKRMRKLMARKSREPSDRSTVNNSTANSNGLNRNKVSDSDNLNFRTKETFNDEALDSDVPKLQSTSKKPLSSLQQKFLSRLSGSRFRELNEELYTTTSASAYKRFRENPELFEQYHEGFRTQVKSWPVNPIDVIYKWIISFYHRNKNDLQEKNQKQLRVADFGCGDAKLAEKLLEFRPNLKDKIVVPSGNESICPFKVHSFDLVANGNKLITPCDMSNVPLKNNSIDVGVFVLALMGTNIADFIREAHRVLTPKGVLKIAEVRSRFESTSGGEDDIAERQRIGGNMKKKSKQKYDTPGKKSDDTILNEFLDVMEQLGFKCVRKDRQNKMFIILEFEKTGIAPSKNASFTAKPCIYKRR